MRILNFHIRGKLAHFRRYYSNSSALSYSVPPRTTVIGFIAGLLGYERDSYYDEFSPSRCRVAVGIRSPQKKKIQTVSLLMIKSSNDFNGSQPFHSQTPTELIMPAQIRTGYLDYEIWFHHQDDSILDKLNAQLQLKEVWERLSKKSKKTSYLEIYQDKDVQKEKKDFGLFNNLFTTAIIQKELIDIRLFGVAMALGTAQHLGWVEHAAILQGEETEEVQSYIHSIVPLSTILELDLADHAYDLHLQKEDLPIHFHNDRTIASKADFMVNASAFPVKATVKRAMRLSDERMITWMEE